MEKIVGEKTTAVGTWSASISSTSPSTPDEFQQSTTSARALASSVPLPPLVRPGTGAVRWRKVKEDGEAADAPVGCRYVWTASTFTWLLPLLVSGCLLIASFLSSNWLLGPDVSDRSTTLHEACRYENIATEDSNFPTVRTTDAVKNASKKRDELLQDRESIGLIGGCHADFNGHVRCHLFPRRSAYLEHSPAVWRVAVGCFAVALGVVILCLLLVLIAPAKPQCLSLSLFGLAGLLQGLAVVALAISVTVFPVAWGSRQVRCVCGKGAAVYSLGLCQAGWPLFVSILALILTGLSALRAANASRSMKRLDVKQFRQVQAAGSCLFINDLRRQHLYAQQPRIISY